MYNFLDTLRRPYADIMIAYLDRIQLGYSALVAHEMEIGMNENAILDDIESMVRRCFADKSVNVINKGNFSNSSEMEEYIQEISKKIFMELKRYNNY